MINILFKSVAFMFSETWWDLCSLQGTSRLTAADSWAQGILVDTAAKEIWAATVTIVSVSSVVIVFLSIPSSPTFPTVEKVVSLQLTHTSRFLVWRTDAVFICVWLLDELLGPIVCIFSLLLGNQGGMGSSYYGSGGGGGSRGSMNGLSGGWGM